jgi:ABC-type branched-subunit amino acid transport system ATPase component
MTTTIGTPALSLRGVSKRFGGVAALSDLALDIALGEIHGLIGPNGAGKTTAINIATGFYVPDGGSVWMFDREVTGLPPHERASLGFRAHVSKRARLPKPRRAHESRDCHRAAAPVRTMRHAAHGTSTARSTPLLESAGLLECATELGRLLPTDARSSSRSCAR